MTSPQQTKPCAPGGFCLFSNGVLVRTDDGCPTHSKRPGVVPAGTVQPLSDTIEA